MIRAVLKQRFLGFSQDVFLLFPSCVAAASVPAHVSLFNQEVCVRVFVLLSKHI